MRRPALRLHSVYRECAMPESEKKESGRSDVEQRERGDVRQRHQPIDKERDEAKPENAQDNPPASRGKDSPWMGGG